VGKKMRFKKATGGDNVAGDVLRLVGENGLKLNIQLINNIYETREWFSAKLQ
jgi:hypothetical protein